MTQTVQWLVRISGLSPETALEISDLFDSQKDPAQSAPLAIAAFCAGDDHDWAVDAHFDDEPDQGWIATLVEPVSIRQHLTPSIQIELVKNRDWVAESLQNLAPVRAGRFFVHGSHDRDKLVAGAIGVEIDAGQAFGTGHHATSTGCLEALDREIRHTRFRNCLDLGCGSALLAIAFAKAVRCPVLATDIDPVAVDVARQNVRLNNQAQNIKCIVADGLKNTDIRQTAPFDLIMANILSSPLIGLANDMRECAASGGTLILSGILARQAPRVEASYKAAGFFFKTRSIREEWATLVLGRP